MEKNKIEFDKIEDAYSYAKELSQQVGNGKVKMAQKGKKWFVWVAGIGAILIGIGLCIA